MNGQPRVKQHLIEFVRGTGILRNGVLIAADSPTGTFSWVVPRGVSRLLAAGCGAGGGGGGGYGTGTALAAGAGGMAGLSVLDLPVFVTPGSTLTITCPDGGAGGAVATDGGVGGATIIAGVHARSPFAQPHSLSTSIYIPGGEHGHAATASGGGARGFQVTGPGGTQYGVVVSISFDAGTTNGTTNLNGAIGAQASQYSNFGPTLSMQAGGGGGAAHTTASSAGGGGGSSVNSFAMGFVVSGFGSNGGSGNTTGTESRGGGGAGGGGPFGRGGAGGAGGSAGSAATGYGAAGGGGGGGAAGGAGTPGYLSFTYFSDEE